MIGKFTAFSGVVGVFISCASLAHAKTSLSRDGWNNWSGQWPGDFWQGMGLRSALLTVHKLLIKSI